MLFPSIFIPGFQLAAAFVIFLTGFITLFSFGLLCGAVGWVLYRCAKRLAVLFAQSQQERLALHSIEPVNSSTRSNAFAADCLRQNTLPPVSDVVTRIRHRSPRSRTVPS
jgi:hypothetical protein